MARTEKEGVPKCAGLAAKEGGRLRMVLREQVTEAGCAEGTDGGHTGTHRLYSGSSSGSSRWHKQAAQGPVSLNGPEQKYEASSLGRVKAGKCKAWRQLSAERGWVSMDRAGVRGRHRGQKQADRAEVCGAGRGENEWARPGSTGSARLVPESPAGAWPGGQTQAGRTAQP